MVKKIDKQLEKNRQVVKKIDKQLKRKIDSEKYR